jgi:hypothetical protein
MAKASNGTPRESEDYFMLANGRRLRVLKPGKRSEGLALGPRASAALRKRMKPKP